MKLRDVTGAVLAIWLLGIVLALVGCNAQHTARVDTDDGAFSGGGGYALHPYRAASHAAMGAFYKAMARGYETAEGEAGSAEARRLFGALKRGWKGFGYIHAGQGGSYRIPGWSGEEMASALSSLPQEVCDEVTNGIADAYDELHRSLKRGTRASQREAAEGAATWRNDWRVSKASKCQ